MENPFILPFRNSHDVSPLCPWRTEQHDQYYVPVDGTERAYLKYQEFLSSNPHLTPVGRIVLVSGGAGCGKTSLIHRCASWTRDHLSTVGGPTLAMVDLNRERGWGVDTSARIQQLCRRVVDEVQLLAILTGDETTQLHMRRDDPASMYPYLGALLGKYRTALAVILPPIEVPEEIVRYTSLSGKNLIFLVETSYDEVSARVESLRVTSAVPVLHVSVDVLRVEDGWRFVEARLKSQAHGSTVAISEPTVKKFMETRISGCGRTTVRELHLTCLNVFQDALEKAKPSIKYIDFMEYYGRKGQLT